MIRIKPDKYQYSRHKPRLGNKLRFKLEEKTFVEPIKPDETG